MLFGIIWHTSNAILLPICWMILLIIFKPTDSILVMNENVLCCENNTAIFSYQAVISDHGALKNE
jgi:hypothetical protein